VQHEAAHVTVGVALGLRLHSAAVMRWVDDDGTVAAGWTWFPEGSREALALMYASGVAWERATGGRRYESGDSRCLRELIGTSRQGFEACVTAAGALLESRAVAHARVTRVLLERDITHEDVQAIAQGARRPQPLED
jgi:hypothetical protein